MKNSIKKSFTLMELLVVVAIIGVLVAITIPAINNARAKARDARRVQDLKEFSAALELYYENHQQYPVWAAGGGFQDSGGNNPLKVLVDEKIISSLPQDPLISKYVYYYITTDNGQTYKTVAYMEQDKQKAEKDGGTASTYYEAFAYPPEKQQAQLTDATLDEKMPVGSSNIALNKPVTSLCTGCQLYGSCSSGCQGPENINDGDRSTSWYYCRCVQRAEIDLQGTYNICQVKGVWCGDSDYPNCSLKLEYFDGSNWQFLAQAAGNSCDSNNPVTINFSCVNAQKIRVNLPPSCEDYCQSEYTCGCPDYCGWVGINEIEVYP